MEGNTTISCADLILMIQDILYQMVDTIMRLNILSDKLDMSKLEVTELDKTVKYYLKI